MPRLHGPLVLAALTAATVAQEPIDRWSRLRAAVQDLGSAERHRAALDELVHAGVDAVPALIEAISSSAREPLRTLGALRAIARLGPLATAAAPILADLLGHPVGPPLDDALLAAVGAVAPWCSAEVVSLRLGLERFRLAGGIPSADYLRAVVRSWFDSGAPDRELELALEHDNAFVQELAAELLGQRGRAARGSLAALHHALTRPRPFLEPGVAVRGPDWAATVVGDFAPRVDAAIAAAMVAIAPHADATIDAWIVRLGDLRPSFREEAAVELGRYGADAARAVPALREALDDTHLAVVREAVTSLGVIGPDAHEALPALELLAGDPDREIAVRARAASRRVRGR